MTSTTPTARSSDPRFRNNGSSGSRCFPIATSCRPTNKTKEKDQVMRFYPITSVLLLCITAIVASGNLSSAKEDQSLFFKEKRTREIDELKRREIHAYGMVVDQGKAPVKGAEVLVSWEEFAIPFPGPIRKTWIKTDDQGQWEFRQRALRARVREARCDGFVFEMKQQDFGGLTSDDVNNNRTSSTNRMTLRLHRLSDPSFLMKQDGRLGRATLEAPLARHFDLFQKKAMPIAAWTNQLQPAFYADLEIRVEPYGTNGAWRIAYRTPGVGDGLIVTNALLFEAPASGYVSECVLDGLHDQDFPRYLYLRTRTPALYSRFDMNYSLRPDSCVVSYESASNPYGTRSLEPDMELEPLWQLREQLMKDARTEITAGRRLNKADLPKLIKEAKDKADKGKP